LYNKCDLYIFQQQTEPNYPEILLIAINKNGMNLIDPKSKVCVKIIVEKMIYKVVSPLTKGQPMLNKNFIRCSTNVIKKKIKCFVFASKKMRWVDVIVHWQYAI
jgi:hypothetical protein